MAERILVVDDSEAKRYGLTRALKEVGYEISEADNGDDAIAQAKLLPSLILLDVRLPPMGGIEVARRLRTDPLTRAIPIIHVSASMVTEAHRAEGLEAGADAYLVAPVDRRVLVATVGAVLRASRAERALRETSERLSNILESASDAFVALDLEWRVTFANKSLSDRLPPGVSVDRGAPIWSVIPELGEPTPRSSLERTMGEGVREPLQLMLPTLGGGWFELRPFKLPEGLGVALEEITERRERQIQERQRLEFAERLVGIISHDIRTPLSAISVSAELLGRGAADPSAARRSVDRIQSSSQRATRLINQMMEWTQASIGGGLPIQRRRVDLEVVLRHTLAEVQAANPTRQFQTALQGETWGEWDADRLNQVFTNLLGNAVQHSPPSSPVVVTSRVAPDTVEISIANENLSGPISPETLESLFEPFRRGPSASRASSSIGLGLYIARHLIERHGGAISVDSSPAGTRFLVRLPR
ncbi:MAG TPA: ATP-binding protein [Myxococcaceae bacterium]|nr:ATP-binding protein [Myxococcaceae bacterium]